VRLIEPISSGAENRKLQKVTLGVLLLVTVVGLALRLYRVVWQGAWYDEAFYMSISNSSFHDMMAKLVADFVQPPFHSYILHAVFQIAGFGDLQARLISVVCGTITIVVVFFLGRYLYGNSAGIFAAILMAVSQLAVMYSQEARNYAMALCLVALALSFYIVAIRERSVKAWVAFVMTAILMIYTHYFTGLAAGFLFAHGTLVRKRFGVPVRWLVWGALAVAVAFVPWLASGVVYNALHSGKTLPESQPNWFSAHWYTILRDVNRFNNGAIDGPLDSAPRCSYVCGLLFLLPALLALKPIVGMRAGVASGKWMDRDSALLLGGLWLVPHLILLVLGIRGMQYDVRYSLFCIVPYYLLVAGGLSSLPRNALRWSWIAAIVLYSALALRATYFVPYKEDYKGALTYIAAAENPDDCAIFLPFETLPYQWEIYAEGRQPPRMIVPGALDAEIGRCGRMWLVKYSRVRPRGNQLKEIEQKVGTVLVKTEERHYFWIDTVLFTRPGSGADGGPSVR
jgi:4-amino-4-deoxy-L-arabinose transferase-like glycosyltransferase